MMLTMTPIEDAWGIDPTSENSFDAEKKKQMYLQNMHNQNNDKIRAFNTSYAYDEMVINVESYNPTRIDLVITDSEIISKLKSMTYKRQQELATDLLKQYFRDNPQSQVHTTQPNRIKVANSSLPPNSSWRNTDDMDLIPTNVDEIVAQTQQQHNMQLLPPDNNTSEQIYGNLNTVNPPNSSNFLSQPNRYNDKNIEFYKADGSSKNDSFLLCILAFLIFVLFERLSCIIKHS